jgi:hypothetical protein
MAWATNWDPDRAYTPVANNPSRSSATPEPPKGWLSWSPPSGVVGSLLESTSDGSPPELVELHIVTASPTVVPALPGEPH